MTSVRGDITQTEIAFHQPNPRKQTMTPQPRMTWRQEIALSINLIPASKP